MLKAGALFLAAMNVQNKMWNLYSTPAPGNEDEHDGDIRGKSNVNIKNLTIQMVNELQQLAAKKESLPATPRMLENGQ